MIAGLALLVAILATGPVDRHWCPMGWQWDGRNCYVQGRAAPDTLGELMAKAAEARLWADIARARAIERYYDTGGALPQSRGKGGR